MQVEAKAVLGGPQEGLVGVAGQATGECCCFTIHTPLFPLNISTQIMQFSGQPFWMDFIFIFIYILYICLCPAA